MKNGRGANRVVTDVVRTIAPGAPEILQEVIPQPVPEVIEDIIPDNLPSSAGIIDRALEGAGRPITTVPADGKDPVTNRPIQAGRSTEAPLGREDKAFKPDFGRVMEASLDERIRQLRDLPEHAVEESGRGWENVKEAGEAVFRYMVREAESTGEMLKEGETRLREGKIVDALFHLAVDPVRNTEENAALAVQESSLVRTIAQVAASAYGGPGGAAAFAAWYTYRATGDPEMALRAGVITGLTSLATSGSDVLGVGGIAAMPSEDIAAKAVLAGAVGGLAVAASGGDAEAIQDGVLQGSAMVVVQELYRDTTTHEYDTRSSIGTANCMKITLDQIGAPCAPNPESFVRKDGVIQTYEKDGETYVEVDIRRTDPRTPHTGTWAKPGETSIAAETSPVMTGISRVPGMNAISLFHDQWSVAWEMDPASNVATIPAAIVVTYMGSEAPLMDDITRSAIARSRQGEENSGTTPAAQSSAAPGTAVDKSDDGSEAKAVRILREVRWSSLIRKPIVNGRDEIIAQVDALLVGDKSAPVALRIRLVDPRAAGSGAATPDQVILPWDKALMISMDGTAVIYTPLTEAELRALPTAK